MTARSFPALLGAFSLLGCADMLGLGGLTFQQEASGGAAAGGTLAVGGSGGAVTFNAGGTLPIGLGGDPNEVTPPPPPSFEDDYPVTWARGAVVTATWPGFGPNSLPANGTFWVYEPDTGALNAHRLNLSEPDELGSTNAAPDWDFFYAPELGGDTWLFAYDQPSGLVAYGPAPLDDEPFDVETQAGSPSWTHLLLAGDPADPFVIAADSETGLVRIGPADPNAEDPLVTAVTWETSFTELLAYRQAETDGLLRLDSVLGQLAFVPIEGGMLGEPVELTLGANPGWSLAATFPLGEGTGLALYRSGDGAIETYFPSANGLALQEDALWRRDLTSIVPVRGDGDAWAVAYDAATGVADVRRLVPLEFPIVVK